MLASAVSAAQQIGQFVQGAPPPRDGTASTRTGTATIRGRVVGAEGGRPLRRARVSLSAPELGSDNRSTSTGADGRYELRGVLPGKYSAVAVPFLEDLAWFDASVLHQLKTGAPSITVTASGKHTLDLVVKP